MPLGQAAGGAKPQRKRSTAKALITASDFTFLGAAKVPNLYPQGASSDMTGLTHRYVDGNLRLISVIPAIQNEPASSNAIWEFSIGSLGTSLDPANLPELTNAQNWGNAGNIYRLTRDLAYNPEDQYLYTVTLDDYDNSSTGTQQTFYRSQFGASAMTGGQGGWYAPDPPNYKASKCIHYLTPTVRQSLGVDHNMAVGFGGYESLHTAGPAHQGPAMYSFNSSVFTGLGTGSRIPTGSRRMLASHPLDLNAVAGVSGQQEGLLTNGEVVNYHTTQRDYPSGSFGQAGTYWGWNYVHGLWVETETRRGVVAIAISYYETRGSNARGIPYSNATLEGFEDDFFKRYTITLDTIPTNLQVGRYYAVNDENRTCVLRGQAGNVLTIDANKDGIDPTGSITTTGKFSAGGWYWASRTWSTSGSVRMLTYDAQDFINYNTNPTPLVDSAILQTAGSAYQNIWSWEGLAPVAPYGTTFDETTGRLYVLMRGGFVNVYQLAS